MEPSTDSASPGLFQVGDWIVDPDSGRLQRGQTQKKIEPKVMQLLVVLAQIPGKVVSRETLEAKVWSGSVVGYDAIAGSVIKLRKALGDSSRNPQYIETVPKKGYRLIAPVKQPATQATTAANTHPGFTKQAPKKKNVYKIVAAGTGIIIAAGLALIWALGPDALHQHFSASAKIPSIAVLPFKNLSDDPRQEYFSDGISEDIIIDLSHISGLSVIARNSSFAYRDTSQSIQDIASELGVEYLLTGSIRKAGDRLRINAELIEARSGRSLWADRYDRRLVDIFELQDEIRNMIVSALSIRLAGAEVTRLSKRSINSFAAYDLFLQGRRAYNEQTAEGLVRAEALYRRAINLDPGFARAYGALGIALSRQFQFDFVKSARNERLAEAYEVAKKAVSIEPTSPQAWWALGFVHLWRGEFEQAADAVEQSVALSPNFADGWALLSQINNVLGRGSQALRFIRKAMVLNPRYTWEYAYSEGRGYYNIGEYEKAVRALSTALKRNESSLYPRLYLAASYFRLGRLEDARWEITRLEVVNPKISLSHLQKSMPLLAGEHRDRLFEDLKQAGMPQ